MTVRGSAIPVGHTVYVAGRAVPVADDGSFVAQEILPSGVHTVEVAVLDEEGNGELYLRDIELEGKDWFYVGMADLTLTSNDSNGPIELLQGENSPNDFDSSADAQLAFFLNGKFNEHWRLTASADTRDGPLEDLFSNFLDKSPDSLFRRIDPDYHFPTFGDDGTVEEMAPTLGKFYAKVGRDESYGEWGNFQVDYMNNELAQVDRGLYGAKLHYESQRATSFGERRFALDGFTAEPGTIASREEFRGTGGSLYFLQRQDLLAGSERVRIEYRDRAPGSSRPRSASRRVSTTTSITCRAACCSPSRSTRRATTTCSCATGRCKATRRTSWCATSTRRASTRSTRCRPARKATTGSASA